MNLRLAIMFALLVVPAHAAVIEVAKNGAVTTIQAGIDLAQAGDTVLVKKGAFAGPVVVSAGKNGLKLKAGAGVILDAFGPLGGPGLTILADDVTVTGLTVRNAVQGSAGDADGILVTGNRARFKNCRVECCAQHGIIVGGADVRIEDCRFSSVAVVCRIAGAGTSRIEDCRFERCSIGIELATTGSTTIEGCRFTTIEFEAIKGTVGAAIDVKACKFRDVAVACVLVDATADVLVEKNSIDTTRNAIAVTGSLMTIRKNKLRHILNDNGAIVANLGTVDVCGNVIDDCNGVGILVGLSAIGTVAANKLTRTAVLSAAAIRIDAVSDCDVTNNRLSKLGGDAIRITEGGGGEIQIKANEIKDCARDGIDIGPTAFKVIVANNVIRRCLAEGIENSGDASAIKNNDVKQCRIDIANDGVAVLNANAFVTGGDNVAPQVD